MLNAEELRIANIKGKTLKRKRLRGNTDWGPEPEVNLPLKRGLVTSK